MIDTRTVSSAAAGSDSRCRFRLQCPLEASCALYDTVHDFPGGAPAMAKRTGENPGILQNREGRI